LAELNTLSKTFRDETASQFQKTGEAFVEIMTGDPTANESIPASQLPAQIELKERLVIGRDAHCDVVLTDRYVSQSHAQVTRVGADFMVEDLGSAFGTFINGIKIGAPAPLKEGERMRVGTATFSREGNCLRAFSEKHNALIRVEALSTSVIVKATGASLNLLEKISFVIQPKEFVALLGPSGSGKSTLMSAINGRRPASAGRVLINEEDLYFSYQYYRRAIGYVPQQDIVHDTLTVLQAMRFAARLRLPVDTSKVEIERIVDGLIQKLGLQEKRHTLIANLSGGQKKRVSLGVELISDPSLLFLDEATSGLDAGTEGKMMTLFRQIADEGATVVCITHNLENVNLCDLVVVLVKGKLAYFGPPAEVAAYFSVSKIGDVYDRLEGESPETWEALYLQSEQCCRYVLGRQQAIASGTASERGREQRRRPTHVETDAEFWHQWKVLRQRYTVATFHDRKNLAIMLAQAPIIAVLIGVVFHSKEDVESMGRMLFLMVIAAIWFGCANASKEISKELEIYLRERAVNLIISAYLSSKWAVLSVLCAIQCVFLTAIVLHMTQLDCGLIPLSVTLFLTSLCGMMMGLVVSAVVDNTDKANAVVPILLIPQVVLAGSIAVLSGLALTLARVCAVSYWAFDAALQTSTSVADAAKHSWVADVFVVLVFSAIMACVAAWALRRKDVLSG